MDVGNPYLLEGLWNTVTPRRRRQVKDYLGASIFSVLATIVSKVDDQALVWSDVKATDCVDKFIQGVALPSNLLREVIKVMNL